MSSLFLSIFDYRHETLPKVELDGGPTHPSTSGHFVCRLLHNVDLPDAPFSPQAGDTAYVTFRGLRDSGLATVTKNGAVVNFDVLRKEVIVI